MRSKSDSTAAIAGQAGIASRAAACLAAPTRMSGGCRDEVSIPPRACSAGAAIAGAADSTYDSNGSRHWEGRIEPHDIERKRDNHMGESG